MPVLDWGRATRAVTVQPLLSAALRPNRILQHRRSRVSAGLPICGEPEGRDDGAPSMPAPGHACAQSNRPRMIRSWAVSPIGCAGGARGCQQL